MGKSSDGRARRASSRWRRRGWRGAGALAAEPKASPHWPQFRGPAGQGVSAEKGLPDEWSATRNVVWKTPIPGRGHSSPVVWGDRIFLTTAIEGEVVPGAKGVSTSWKARSSGIPRAWATTAARRSRCSPSTRDDGRVVWERTADEGLPFDTRHQRGSFASQTPVTDGSVVVRPTSAPRGWSSRTTSRAT